MEPNQNSKVSSHSMVRIIVHPAGALDFPDTGYWTEVVQFPCCIAEANSEENVVEQTMVNIRTMSATNPPGIVIERAL